MELEEEDRGILLSSVGSWDRDDVESDANLGFSRCLERLGRVVGFYGVFVGDLGLDREVTWVDCLAEEADEDAIGESGRAHPADVVSS